MSIRNARNFNRGVKKLNSSFSTEFSDSSATGAQSYQAKGVLKRGLNQKSLSLEIAASGGQGGAGATRAGSGSPCKGGSGGGGGGSVFLYVTDTFSKTTIPYNIGASGPNIGGVPESGGSPAPSGNPTTIFGYNFGNGGNGGASSYGKAGNPGEPPCYTGGSGGGGAGGSVPQDFVNTYGMSGLTNIDFSSESGGGGAAPTGALSGVPGCGRGDNVIFGPFPVGGPEGYSQGPKQPAGFVQIRNGNRFHGPQA